MRCGYRIGQCSERDAVDVLTYELYDCHNTYIFTKLYDTIQTFGHNKKICDDAKIAITTALNLEEEYPGRNRAIVRNLVMIALALFGSLSPELDNIKYVSWMSTDENFIVSKYYTPETDELYCYEISSFSTELFSVPDLGTLYGFQEYPKLLYRSLLTGYNISKKGGVVIPMRFKV